MKPLLPNEIIELRQLAEPTVWWVDDVPVLRKALAQVLDAEAYWRNEVANANSSDTSGNDYGGADYCNFCGEEDDTLPAPIPRHSKDYIARYEQQERETALFQPNRPDVINGVIQDPIKVNDCTRHKLDCPYVFANQLKRWES